MKFPLFCLFILHLSHGSALNDCKESRCSKKGPPIRFPFRINNIHPDHCGYPGFDLSCTETQQTSIHLPNSVKLIVDEIDYASQVIHTSDPNNCLPKQLLNFNLSNSAFKFGPSYSYDYSFFNCSSAIDRLLYLSMPCLSVPGFDIHAFVNDSSVYTLPLTACKKMYNLKSVPNDFISRDNVLHLNWSRPPCGVCEAQGKYCRFRNNTANLETECFDKPKPKSRTGIKLMAAGIVVGVFLLVLVGFILYRIYSSDKAEKQNQVRVKKFLEDYKALKPTRFSYADLKRITNRFTENLGQGAYGTVFKGILSNEISVAVKVLTNSTTNGEDFINEVGTMVRIHHVNVVHLVGFCADGFRRALVYEYLPNDSLEKFITSNDENRDLQFRLEWEKLEDIAIGIAKGIEYLHQGCDQRILHFDIKPHNILLDENFNPKISDFGLAKLCAKDQSAISMTTARGTMGYIAPEVFSRNFGNVSYKSDIYSFGMVLLDMVKGRKNIDVADDKNVYFPEWVYNRLDQGDELRIRIKEEKDEQIAKKLIIVGLWCIQWNPMDRPTMCSIVQMLQSDGSKLTMPPNPFKAAGDAYVAGKHPLHKLAAISEAEQS